MVSPNSRDKSCDMSIRSFLLWGFVCFLGVTTFVMHHAGEPNALTLEHGLGPSVETTRL